MSQYVSAINLHFVYVAAFSILPHHHQLMKIACILFLFFYDSLAKKLSAERGTKERKKNYWNALDTYNTNDWLNMYVFTAEASLLVM